MKALIFNIQKFSLHDGPGIRTTVFFQGCNLRCNWCANPESQALQPESTAGIPDARWYTLEELLKEALKDKPFYDQSGGGVTFSGGEPLLQPEFVCAFVDALHENGVPVGIETSLSVDATTCASVLSTMDFAYIDLKHWDSRLHKEGTGICNTRILQNLRAARQMRIPLTVRIPIIPGYNDTLADAEAFVGLLADIGATGAGTMDICLLPFHQFGEAKYYLLKKQYLYKDVPQLHEEDLEAYAAALRSYGLDVQVGG